MRRRPSGSGAEEEGEDDSAAPPVDFLDIAHGPGAISKSSKSDDKTQSQTSARLDAKQHTVEELDRRKSIDVRPATARSRHSNNTNWKLAASRNGTIDKDRTVQSTVITVPPEEATDPDKMPDSRPHVRRSRLRSPWTTSLLTLGVTAIAILSLLVILHSFVTRQLDTKGCRMSYMRPAYAKLSDFDTEHTRFASKYSVYLYREVMVDEDIKV